MEDRLERGVVAPMHVLEGDEHRLRPCEDRNRLRQRVKQPALVRLGIDGGTRTRVGEDRPELGEDPHEVGCSRRENVGNDGRRDRAGEQPHQIEQRSVRDRAFRLEARAVQGDEARPAGFVGHGAKQAGLTDACLADDHCDSPAATAGGREHVANGGYLRLATDEGWADDVVVQVHETRCLGV